MKEQEAIERLRQIYDYPIPKDTKRCEALKMAIEALEKQITSKVIYARTSGGQSGYLCPVCENYLDHTIPNYCCKCGQKIELGQWD